MSSQYPSTGPQFHQKMEQMSIVSNGSSQYHMSSGGQYQSSLSVDSQSGMAVRPPSQPRLPGMNMGPPHPGLNTRPHQSGMNMGPPQSGMNMGLPSQSGGNTGSPSLPGMSMGTTSQPGMNIRPSQPLMNTGRTFLGPTSQSGMNMGPPQLGMNMGPPQPGMNMGPPQPGMNMGPPQPGINMRPPQQGMNMGPPQPRMNMGPPQPGMNIGPPQPGMNMGPPQPGMNVGPSSQPRMHMGPPHAGMNPGPPSQPMRSSLSTREPTSNWPHGGMNTGPGIGSPPPPPQKELLSNAGAQGMVPGLKPTSGAMSVGPNMGPIQSQPQQQMQRINPDTMPNPITLMKDNEEKYGGQVYHTSNSTAGIPPPLVTTNFTVQDNGNCDPRFMRSTLYTVPSSKDLVNQCRIPLGVVIQPFASIPISENTLSIVDHGQSGPIRCNRCKAYMNPYCRFVDGGRHYICPICQCSNEVSPEFFCHLDHTGNRTDIANRPELLYGSIEYCATKDYCKDGLLPDTPAYIFMIDVSISSIQSGIVNLLSQTMLSILDHLPKNSTNGSPIKIGFVTYDRVIHYYNVKECLTQPQMIVVSDISDVFVPVVDGFLVDIEESRAVIDNLMAQIPDMFAGNKTSDVIFEPVVRAGLEALKAAKRNGRLFIFHSNLPTASGPGQLTNRLDTKLLGTDKEKVLLSSVGGPYTKLAQECVKHGVGVEIFSFPSTEYCDVATLSILAQTTGGEMHLYPKLQTATDGERLIADVVKSVSRDTGFDCVMRVRCSAGIRAVNYYGGFFMANTTDIEFGNIDSDKAVAIEIKHDDKMKEDIPAYIQAALLYTNIYGERRLRVHNMSLKCSSKFSDIYQSSELDTIINFLCKSVCTASQSMAYKAIRETLTNQCAIILSCYRKQCSKQSPPGQLILPDSLKLLPLYAGCLLKCDALLSPPMVSIDEKCFQMHKLMTMNIKESVAYLYPRLLNLEPVVIGSSDPEIMRCTSQKMNDSGLYLITNGLTSILWVGQHVSNAMLSDVFGVASHSQVDTNIHSLPALDNPTSFRIRAILKELNQEHGHQLKFHLAKQRDKSEVSFRRLLKEDKGSGPWEGISYIDYLCQLHKDIREILS